MPYETENELHAAVGHAAVGRESSDLDNLINSLGNVAHEDNEVLNSLGAII